MTPRYIFDIECNGFLEDVTEILSLVMINIDNGEMYSAGQPEVPKALKLLEEASEIAGHNVLNFDLPVIQKLYPSFKCPQRVTDTLVVSRVLFSDIRTQDSIMMATKQLPSNLYGSHSLEAWGYRMGLQKLEYKGSFEKWTPELQVYCEQDTRVTEKLYHHLKKHQEQIKFPQAPLDFEHDVARLTTRIEVDGWEFDMKKAMDLYAHLAGKRETIKQGLKDLFPPWEVFKGTKVYKVANKKRGIAAGDSRDIYETVEFNPSSRAHIEKCLKDKYGWQPKSFTPSGQAEVNDEILRALEYPEAQQLAEYFMLEKRIGMLAEGEHAWIKYASKDGKVHGRYNPNGTVTGRMTHQSPNIAQVPAVGVPYGKDCRELFTAPPGWVLVGSDMAGLELRCLAHYLAYYDNGEYAKAVCEGDIHTSNMKAAGLSDRNAAKRFIYAFLYGAGAQKIAEVIGRPLKDAYKVKEDFMTNTPGLQRLQQEVQGAGYKGYIKSLDGRHIPIRHNHAALNSLLQSTGAILCKQWVLNIDRYLEESCVGDVKFVGLIHDECQIAVRKEFAEEVGQMCIKAAEQTAEDFKFKCPLKAEYKIGASWAETH